jgi:hypothetical protein
VLLFVTDYPGSQYYLQYAILTRFHKTSPEAVAKSLATVDPEDCIHLFEYDLRLSWPRIVGMLVLS